MAINAALNMLKMLFLIKWKKKKEKKKEFLLLLRIVGKLCNHVALAKITISKPMCMDNAENWVN